MAELKIKADSGGGTVSLKGPATTTSNAAVQLTLPVDDGTANQYLKTDGSGALSWATVDTSIADDSIVEAKLDIHAAPSGTDKFLGYTSNGMEWATPTAPSGWVKVFSTSTTDSTGVLTIENTSLFDGTYKRSMIVVYHSMPNEDSKEVRLQAKLNGSYVTSADYAYHWRQRNSASDATVIDNNVGKAHISLIESVGNATGEGFEGIIEWNDSTSTTHWKRFNWTMGCGKSNGDIAQNIGNGGVNGANANTALTGVKLLMSSGTFGPVHYAGFGLTL